MWLVTDVYALNQLMYHLKYEYDTGKWKNASS